MRENQAGKRLWNALRYVETTLDLDDERGEVIEWENRGHAPRRRHAQGAEPTPPQRAGKRALSRPPSETADADLRRFATQPLPM